MPITLEQYNKVQSYLDGEMTEVQQQAFLSELQVDEELRQSCEFEKYLRQNAHSIRHTDDILSLSREEHELSGDPERTAAVRALIQKAGDEWRHEQVFDGPIVRKGPAPVVPIRRNTWIAVAASLILIAGSLIFFLHRSSSKATGAELFAAFFKKEEVPEGRYPMLGKALADYKNNNYTTLQQYDLENMPVPRGPGDQANERERMLQLGYYYRGISYLVTGDPEKAAASLQWVIDHGSPEELIWKAQWYKALALVKISHTEEAIKLLQTVAANTQAEGYSQQANTLLHKLEENAH